MKVLYLVPQPTRAERLGAYTFLDEEIHALAEAGVDAYVLSTAAEADRRCGKVRVIAAGARAAFAGRIDAAMFLARCVDAVPRRNLCHLRSSYRAALVEHLAATLVQDEGIDVIHSHFAWPKGFGGVLARAATGRPLVACLRGTDILLDRTIGYGRRAAPFFDRALRVLLARADRTVYFSRYMRDQALLLGARPEAARVISKGVDLGRFTVADDRAALRAELGLGRRPMILTVAGLIPRKGVHHILEALARLERELDFTFVVCGDGPERANLEALGARLGLADRTVFTGWVDRDRIPRYFAACDVFVLASVVEAAGNVLFEAMAAGRPVVCTESGGPAEYVRHGETGFVVPVGDPDALATRLGQLLRDPSLQDLLGREARRRTIGAFDHDRMVSDLIALYRELLHDRPALRVAV